MANENLIPEATAAPAPAVVAPATETAKSGSDVDIEKVDNLAQVREWGKGLKADLDAVKPAHEFITSTFGTLDNAKIGANVYNSFAGEDFDPDSFYKTLEQLSPARAKQLFEKYASTQASELAKKEVEKLLGGHVAPEEVRLFKQFRESGYGLGDGDELPESLKYDSAGNPRSDEELAFFKELQKQVKDTKTYQHEKESAAEAEKLAKQQARVQETITNFANDRLKILDKEFKVIGLDVTDGDTAEIRDQKSFVKQFLINGITGAFVNDPDGSKDYNSAVRHIESGEDLLARRYEARIEAKLVEIMRSKAVKQLVDSFTKAAPTKEVKPEITTGASLTTNAQTSPVTGDDIYSKLINQGLIAER